MQVHNGFKCSVLFPSGYRADFAIYNCLTEGLCNNHLVDEVNKLFSHSSSLQKDLHLFHYEAHLVVLCRVKKEWTT